jgi:uncharacterized protein YidB (DUF937 family)
MEDFMGLVDGLLGGGGEGPMAALSGLIKGHDGGLGGLVEAFEKGGLSDAARSWVSTGANLPVSAAQIEAVLGSGPVAQFAEKLGVDPHQAAGQLAQLLPQVVDHLTPNGAIPSGALGALEGLLDRFKG